MTAIGDSLMQCVITLRNEHENIDVRLDLVGESQHPLEMSQPDAAAAIGAEQRPRGHEVVARAAAHACIRCRARTTSSWSEDVIAG